MNELIVAKHQHAGEYETFQNILFAQVNNAGHMIGMDQPEVIYQLFSLLVRVC